MCQWGQDTKISQDCKWQEYPIDSNSIETAGYNTTGIKYVFNCSLSVCWALNKAEQGSFFKVFLSGFAVLAPAMICLWMGMTLDLLSGPSYWPMVDILGLGVVWGGLIPHFPSIKQWHNNQRNHSVPGLFPGNWIHLDFGLMSCRKPQVQGAEKSPVKLGKDSGSSQSWDFVSWEMCL